MLKLLPEILICLLAVYGALALSIIVINSIFQRVKPEISNVRFVLMVKDREETIEGIVRGMFSCNLLRKVIPDSKLFILDLGSTDETLKILNKLKNDCEHIEVLNWEEKERIFDGFEENL